MNIAYPSSISTNRKSSRKKKLTNTEGKIESSTTDIRICKLKKRWGYYQSVDGDEWQRFRLFGFSRHL
jgi:hypothetical protein